MKIVVFSDSHRNISLMSRVLEKVGDEIKMAIHLGDCICDAKQLEMQFPDIRFYRVRGNCDFCEGSDDEMETIVTARGKKILLTHGHKYDVKFGYLRIMYAAEEKQVDACLFGHTHQPAMFTCGPVFFMNPGSISKPRALQNPSYGVLSISQYGLIDGQIISRCGTGFKPMLL